MPITSERAESKGSLTRFRAKWVRDRMDALGFDRVEDLAVAAGISRVQMQNYLAGRHLPSTPTAKRLAVALRCTSDDLTEEVPAEGAQR